MSGSAIRVEGGELAAGFQRLRADFADNALNPVALRAAPEFKGWAGADLPSRVGGLDYTPAAMARVFRDCGAIDLELRDLVGAGHARYLTLVPGRSFDPLLRSVANGASYCAVAITEPDVGSDLHSLTSSAMIVEGGYVLDGVKQHISRIDEASHFIVFAAVRRDGFPALVTAFLVPKDVPGVVVERMSPMGMSTVSWGRVHLRNVRIDAGQRIGGEGQAISLFVRHFSYWRTMMAAAAIGSAQAAIDQTVERLKTRQAFGGPIGRFTHLQQGLATAVSQLRMAWLLIESVAAEFEKRTWPVFDAAMAKAEGVEAALAAVDWTMRVHGASGYDEATGLEKRYRDLLGLRVADGTTDMLRGQVARALLGERMYELSLNRDTDKTGVADARRSFW